MWSYLHEISNEIKLIKVLRVTIAREQERSNGKLFNGLRVSNSHKKAIDAGYTFNATNFHTLEVVNFKVYFISIKS